MSNQSKLTLSQTNKANWTYDMSMLLFLNKDVCPNHMSKDSFFNC